jgi:hypothetical protein
VRPILIPVYDIDHDTAYFFRSDRAAADPHHAFRMRDVLRAATAAPAFFPPGRVTSDAGDVLSCIDGGLVAFNPALWAYLEGRALAPQAEEVVVASFGVVRRTHGLTYDTVRGWGRVNWAGPVFELICDADAADTHAQLTRLLPPDAAGERVVRLEARIERPRFATMDDVSTRNIRSVEETGREMLAREDARLAALCRRLTGG